ncbi:MAG: hypothetical protein ACYDA8_18870 [Deferrisomatales bacterium]
MTSRPTQRFIFLGGAPVFDYMIPVPLPEIQRVTGDKVYLVGSRVLLPLGTVFEVAVRGAEKPLYLNPLACGELQHLRDEPYYALELGGKHPEQGELRLRGELEEIAAELAARFPHAVKGPGDLKVVRVPEPAEVHLGGNNKNILEAIHALYASPELAGLVGGFTFEHPFFADWDNPKFGLVQEVYRRWGVSLGGRDPTHVAGLLPRIGYVLTLSGEEGRPLDRIILSNRTNEETIPVAQLGRLYSELEYGLRRDADFVETHLVINSMTNHEEVRHLVRLLKTAYAGGVTCHLCPTKTFLSAVDRVIRDKYYAVEAERFYQYRKDFVDAALLPYVQYLILNKEELELVDGSVAKRGIDAAASSVAQQMNRGGRGEGSQGGRVVVTGGSQGARYTERLSAERARVFWRKAGLPEGKPVGFADRRIVCGDDYVTSLVSTLGAGDLFSGVFVGLTALGWDGGHALRAATLAAQHFIQYRTRPSVQDLIAVDEAHVRLGTETELTDRISHYVRESGDPTRYGTISDTVITVLTAQIQHPFREVLALAQRFAERRPE